MQIDVNGQPVYLATGGKEFDANQPCVVLLHGSGMDHRAYALQARALAYSGYSVVVPDFPAHSLSGGEPLTSIEQSADWLGELLAALAIESCHLVGHSQGFLTALEYTSRDAAKVSTLVGIGTASAIPVNPALIDTAKSNPSKAAQMMLTWGFGQRIHQGLSPTPGMQPIGASMQIMAKNPLAIDLQCCADYQGGEQACDILARAGGTATAMILADKDKMTPLKGGLATATALGAQAIVLESFGHMLPIEAPKLVLTHLTKLIGRQAS